MQVTTFGAIFGLLLAIFLIVKKFEPVYGLMIGAFLGGIIGGADINSTIEFMANGAMGIAPSILRVLASGVLAGSLIKTRAVDKISEEIIKILGEKRAILGIALSTLVLASVGINLDVAIITVAPVGLCIGQKLNYSKMSILLAMLGGGKAGNIISPNPNTLAVSENFSVNLLSVMQANIIPAIIILIMTTLLAKTLIHKGSYILQNNKNDDEKDLPGLFPSLIGPIVSMVLMFIGNISDVSIDPLIALPLGGMVTIIATKNLKNTNECVAFGLNKMQGVCILLLGSGTLAGIIQVSGIQESTINLLNILNIPQFLLAPIAAIFMSLATASSTTSAMITSATFSDAIISAGLSPLSGASIVNTGACVFEQLPHGSLFHSSSQSVSIDIKERLKLIPYEVFIGIIFTAVSTAFQLLT